MLRNAYADRFDTGSAAEVGNPRHLGDMRDFLVRLDHSLPHRGCRDINEFDALQFIFQLAAQIQIDMIKLDSDALGAFCQIA